MTKRRIVYENIRTHKKAAWIFMSFLALLSLGCATAGDMSKAYLFLWITLLILLVDRCTVKLMFQLES
jgi:hypothetical protein